MNILSSLKKSVYLSKGIGTYLPRPVRAVFPKHQDQFFGSGVRVNQRKSNVSHVARSAYTSWMRTLVALDQFGIKGPFESVGEIGPGDSFSVGLAAMLSGTNHYFALDVVDTATNFSNLDILDELIKLFQKRESIPGNVEFPKNRPHLLNYMFPSRILPDSLLEKTLSPERIQMIKDAIRASTKKEEATGEISIDRVVEWDREDKVSDRMESMDLIMSFAAMEHVEDVANANVASAKLLKKGGYVAHAIDYKSHGTSGYWNGQWTYSEFEWNILKGKTIFLINRHSHSHQLHLLRKEFDIVIDDVYVKPNSLERSDLADRFRDMPDSDLVTSEAFIVARKK